MKALSITLITMFCIYAENQNNRTNWMATSNATSRATPNSITASPTTASIMDDDSNHLTDSQFQDNSEMIKETSASNVFSFADSIASLTEFMRTFQMWSSVIGEIQGAIQHPFIPILKLLRQLEMPIPTGVSEACRKHVRLFFTDLLDTFIEHKNPMDQWSVQILDAMAKLPSGVLRGAITWPGSFRQCTDISVASKRVDGAEEQHFVGEHCMVQIKIPETVVPQNNENKRMAEVLEEQKINLTIGMCFPSSCNNDDKQILTQTLASQVNLTTYVDPMTCRRKEGLAMDTTAIVLSVVLAIPAVIVLFGTTLELSKKWITPNHLFLKGKLARSALTFSLQRSWTSVVSINKDSEFNFIEGIRFLSITWIVYFHTELACTDFKKPWREMKDLEDLARTDYMKIISGAVYAVDTFLFLSGFCAVYFFLKSKLRTKTLDVIMIYIRRYIRLTPSFAYIVALTAGPWIYFGNGPFVFSNVEAGQNCRTIWWKNLLYVANLQPWDGNVAEPPGNFYCVPPTWYLMVDIQLFLIVPPILVLLIRKPKWGLSILGLLLIASITARGLLISFKELPYIYNHYVPKRYHVTFYSKPWTRAPPFLIGMGVGYYLHKVGLFGVKIKSLWVNLGWLGSIAIISTLVNFNFSTGNHVSRVLNVFLGTFGSGLWALVMTWVVVACSSGHGGFITRFLSCEMFVRLGRLSYCIYLIHWLVIDFYFGSSQGAMYGMNQYFLLNLFLSTMVICVAYSFCLYAMIESPMSALKLRLTPNEPKERPITPDKNYCSSIASLHKKEYKERNEEKSSLMQNEQILE